MTNKQRLKQLIKSNTDSVYLKLAAIEKLYPDSYGTFPLKIDVNKTDLFNYTALMRACEHNDYYVAKVLLEAGADINIQGIDGSSALILASKRYATKKLVKLLLKYNPNLELKDNNGNTALLVAYKQFREDLTCLLIDSGADVNATNNFGETPLILAYKNIKLNPQLNKSNNYDEIKKLIQAGADVNAVNMYNESIFTLAKQYNDTNIISLISTLTNRGEKNA